MITDQQIRSVTAFFFLGLLDEELALRTSQMVLASLKTRLRGFPEGDPETNVIIIKTCVSQFAKLQKQITRGKSSLTFESGWHLPAHTELAPWTRFHKDASDDELLALLLAQVMRFSTHEIAVALSISEGTARYRVGRAVRQLGAAHRLAL